LDVGGRRLKYHLKLRMFVESIGILAVASVGGPTARLHKSCAIWSRPKNTQKRFRVHGAGTDLDVIRLLQDTTLLDPEMRERQNQILEIQTLRRMLKFYFNSQVVSRNSRVCKFRSV